MSSPLLALWLVGSGVAAYFGTRGAVLAIVGVFVIITTLGWMRPALTHAAFALVVLITGVLSSVSLASLDAPLPSDVAGIATLETDPRLGQFGTRVVVSIEGRRYELEADRSVEASLVGKLAGSRLLVEGRVRALEGPRRAYLRQKHVAGRIVASELREGPPMTAPYAAANGFRHLLVNGAESLTYPQQALLTGLVYGDDRNQPAKSVEEFRDSGLAHLLAVSGSNVAFVLALLAPLITRLSRWMRAVISVVVLLFFALVTRAEPSVLRAEAMALLALWIHLRGRRVEPIRVLVLGTTLALLADPFLVRSVGFQLSVSACLGMALLGEALANRLPGPLLLRRAMAYSGAAQLGATPVSVVVFGEFPEAGLLCNLLAEPLAALIMCWGVVGGLLAGVFVELGLYPVSTLLHYPTSVLLELLERVAQLGAFIGSQSYAALFGVLTFGGLLAWVAGNLVLYGRRATRVSH